ncbi:MAG: DUF6600 domain-containing protein [Acidobacteriota bacterium]
MRTIRTFMIVVGLVLLAGCDVRTFVQGNGSPKPSLTPADLPRQGDAAGTAPERATPVPAAAEPTPAPMVPASYDPQEGQGEQPSAPADGSSYADEPQPMDAGMPGGEEAMVPARMSYLQGQVYVKGAQDGDWSLADLNIPIQQGDSIWADADSRAEVELTADVLLRMAADARVDVVSLSPDVMLKGWVGAFFVKVPAQFGSAVHVEAPGASIELNGGSYLRVDIAEDGYTRYTVYSGEAGVADPQGTTMVPAVSRFYVDPGSLPSDPEAVEESSYDDFDAWANERDNERPAQYERPSYQHVGRELPGEEDLDDNGSWVDVEGETYYAPRVTGSWRPYSNGYWTYVAPYGYTWISYDPFGYVTHHYGSWTYHAGYGWLWFPGAVWAPHRCYFTTYGDSVFWAPLDPWGRPVVLGGVDIRIGNVDIDLHAWSYLPVRGFVAGSRSISAPTVALWKGPVTMNVVAPAKKFRPALASRTPFVIAPDGAPVHKKVEVVQARLHKIPAPGIHVVPGTPAGKTPPAKVKLPDPHKPFKVVLPPSKSGKKGPPTAPILKPAPAQPPVAKPPKEHPGKPREIVPPPMAPQPAPRVPPQPAPPEKGKPKEVVPPPAPRPAPYVPPQPAPAPPKEKGKPKEVTPPPAPRPAPYVPPQPAPAPPKEKGKPKEVTPPPAPRPAPYVPPQPAPGPAEGEGQAQGGHLRRLRARRRTCRSPARFRPRRRRRASRRRLHLRRLRAPRRLPRRSPPGSAEGEGQAEGSRAATGAAPRPGPAPPTQGEGKPSEVAPQPAPRMQPPAPKPDDKAKKEPAPADKDKDAAAKKKKAEEEKKGGKGK